LEMVEEAKGGNCLLLLGRKKNGRGKPKGGPKEKKTREKKKNDRTSDQGRKGYVPKKESQTQTRKVKKKSWKAGSREE